MAGIVQPLSKGIYKGESKTFRFTVLDDDKTKRTIIDGVAHEGARVDISGVTIEFEVNFPLGPPYAAVISKATGSSSVEIADQTSADTKGDFSVALTPADTKDLAAKLYKYDVWLTDPAGYRRCVVPASDFRLLEPVNGAP